MDFRKCFDCVLVKKLEPGLAIDCNMVGVYTLVCMATGEKIEIKSCIKDHSTKEE